MNLKIEFCGFDLDQYASILLKTIFTIFLFRAMSKNIDDASITLRGV